MRIQPNTRPRRMAGNRSPVSDATTGVAAPMPAPNASCASSSAGNVDANPAATIAADHSTTQEASSRTRRTRSASTPKGSVVAAPSRLAPVISRPIWVLSRSRSALRLGATAPTIVWSPAASASAPDSRTIARSSIVRLRARSAPRLRLRCSLAVASRNSVLPLVRISSRRTRPGRRTVIRSPPQRPRTALPRCTRDKSRRPASRTTRLYRAHPRSISRFLSFAVVPVAPAW